MLIYPVTFLLCWQDRNINESYRHRLSLISELTMSHRTEIWLANRLPVIPVIQSRFKQSVFRWNSQWHLSCCGERGELFIVVVTFYFSMLQISFNFAAIQFCHFKCKCIIFIDVGSVLAATCRTDIETLFHRLQKNNHRKFKSQRFCRAWMKKWEKKSSKYKLQKNLFLKTFIEEMSQFVLEVVFIHTMNEVSWDYFLILQQRSKWRDSSQLIDVLSSNSWIVIYNFNDPVLCFLPQSWH